MEDWHAWPLAYKVRKTARFSNYPQIKIEEYNIIFFMILTIDIHWKTPSLTNFPFSSEKTKMCHHRAGKLAVDGKRTWEMRVIAGKGEEHVIRRREG
jgi:hypothetical protein